MENIGSVETKPTTSPLIITPSDTQNASDIKILSSHSRFLISLLNILMGFCAGVWVLFFVFIFLVTRGGIGGAVFALAIPFFSLFMVILLVILSWLKNLVLKKEGQKQIL